MQRIVFACAIGSALSLALTACSPSPTPATCITGERPVCGCGDSLTGYQECLADGTFGPCVCTDPLPGTDMGMAPIDSGTTPVDFGTEPVDLGTEPVDLGTEPVDFGTTPVDLGTTPVDLGTTPGGLSIVRTAPARDIVHTRDTLMLQFVVARSAERVELLLDGAVLAELTPPYTYAWDTRPYAEGAHTIVARAVRGTDVALATELTVTVDRTSPYVVSRFPVPGETNVWLAVPFEVVFSEALAPSTVNDTAIVITNGSATPLRKALTLDASGTRLSVVLDVTPTLPTTLRFDVTSAATDLAGNPVVSDVWPLTIPVWHRVGDAAGRVGYATDLALTMDDANAHPYVAWIATDIVVAHHDGTAWTTLPSVEPDLTATPSQLVMAADATGAPVVAWVSTAPGGIRQILAARWTGSAWASLGAGWTSMVYNPFPQIAIDAAGAPVIAWIYDGTTLRVERWTGSAWSAVGSSITPTSTASLLGLAVQSTGELVIAYGGATAAGASALQWNGAAWAALGGPVFTATSYYGPGTISLNALRLISGPDGALAATGTGYAIVPIYGSQSFAQIARLRASAWEPWLTPGILAFGTGGLGMNASSNATGVSVARELATGWRTTSLVTAANPRVAIDVHHGRYPAIAVNVSSEVAVYLSNDL